MTSVLKIFNGLATGLTQAQYQLYSPTIPMVLVQDWTLVNLTPYQPPGATIDAYQALIPLPPGFLQGYIVTRDPANPAATVSSPEEITTGLFVPSTATPAPVVSPSRNNVGLAMARQKEVYIAKMGSTVTLPNGTTRIAMVHHNNHDLLRGLKSDGDSPEKKPVVFVFGGSAWGLVTEGARISIGAGGMLRDFIVADPLHPNWRQDVIVELAVVAWSA